MNETIWNDTFSRYTGWRKDQVMEKIEEIGHWKLDDPLEDRQNDSPTMKMLFEFHEDEQVTYDGFIARLPRFDFAVTVDGFTMVGLTKSKALSLQKIYWALQATTAVVSEGECEEEYDLYVWWD